MNRVLRLLHDRVVVGLLSAVGLLVLLGQVLVWYPRYALHPPAPDDGFDFRIYQRAAARAARGVTPYESCAHAPEAPPGCLLYPPPFAAAIAPAGHLSPAGFQKGAYLVLLLAFWAYAAGLVKLSLGRVGASETLIAGVALFVTPGLNITMSLGNLDLVVWALVAWGLTADAAFPLLVVAAAFKIWPVVSLAVLVAAKPARLRPVIFTTVLLFAAAVAILGASSFRDWRELAVPGLQAGTLRITNVSVVAILGRLGIALPAPLRMALPAAGALAIWLALPKRNERLRASLCGIAAMICAPICWWKYAPILLIPLAIWISGLRPTEVAASPAAAVGADP
jgi:hypothetical protein